MNEARTRLRSLIIFVLTAILVPLLIFLFFKLFTTGRLVIEVPEGQSYAVRIYTQKDGGEVGISRTISGSRTLTLASGEYEVQVFSGSGATTYFVEVPRFLGSKKLSSSIQNEANRQKLGREINSCPVYADKQLYSYNCFGNSAPVYHTKLSEQSYSSRVEIPSFEDQIGLGADAMPGGLLVLYQEVDKHDHGDSDERNYKLALVNGSSVTRSLELPQEYIKSIGSRSPSLAVDNGNSGSFVVYARGFDTFLYYQNIDAAPKQLVADLSSMPVEAKNTHLELNGNTVLVVHGTLSTGDADEIEEHITRVLGFDVATGENRITMDIPSDFETVSMCQADSICITTPDSVLSIYSITTGKLKLRLNGVVMAVGAPEDQIAYIKNRNVFLLNKPLTESRQLFGSQRFSVSSIFHSGNDLLFTAIFGRNAADSKTVHVFRLDVKPSESGKFADDVIPFEKSGASEIQDMDYSDNSVLTTILLDSSARAANGQITYDPSEYQKVTEKIVSRLKREGISSPEYSINFIVTY